MQMCEVVCCRLVRASIVTFTDQQQQQRSALADLPYRLASLSTARSLSTSAMNVPSSAGPLQDFEWSPTRRRVAGPTAVPTNSAASARNYLVAASSSSLTPPSSSSSLPSSTTPAAEWWRADSDGSCGVSVASATGPPPPLVESRQTPPPAPLRAASAASSSALWYPLVAREPQQRTPPAASQRAASQHASHCSPSLLDNSFLLSPPSAWPSIVDALETPERQRCQHLASTDNSHTHDSGFFDSSTDCASNMLLRPPPALRTPLAHGPSSLNSPLRTFFFKSTPSPSEQSQRVSLSKTENAIGVRISGASLRHVRSPQLIATIANQNTTPDATANCATTSAMPHLGVAATAVAVSFAATAAPSAAAAVTRSPLRRRNNGDASTFESAARRAAVETPSKCLQLEMMLDDMSGYGSSPLKSSFFYPTNNELCGANEQSCSAFSASSSDWHSSLDTGGVALSTSIAFDGMSRDDSLSDFSLSLNSSNDSAHRSTVDSAFPGSMSCTKAARIRVPRISSRTKSLIYGRSSAQREITKQANGYWRRHCAPDHRTNMPLCATIDEFEQIDWHSRGPQSTSRPRNSSDSKIRAIDATARRPRV